MEQFWNWRDPRVLLEDSYTERERDGNYNGYGTSKAYFGSYAPDATAMALHAVFHTTSFVDSMTMCINWCGDADTTGAVMAQISGALYGARGIPKELTDLTEKWDGGGGVKLRAALLYGMGVVESESESQSK